jgi:F0F1-type ATP synthase assembly protein I
MDFFNQQFRQFTQQPQQKSLWQQSMRFRYGFVAGIIVGIFFGWFFHGIVSLVIRLGILAILLIPIIAIAWFFLRSRGSSGPDDVQQPQGRVFTIGNVPPFMRGSGQPAAESPPARETEPVIDLNADDYDLEKFKKRLEQEN